MEDVARMAGVSLKSVSRVVNREPHVSERLRAKVEAAIVALDYVPDTAARSLAGSRSFVIGLLFDNPSPNYTLEVQAGVYRACTEHQYHLRIDEIAADSPPGELDKKLAAILRNGRCDGFVLTPPLTDNRQILDTFDRKGIRYVRLAPDNDRGRAPGVIIDDEGAAALVARHLWSLGHRRYGIVTGAYGHGSADRRREGFIRALAELGSAEPPAEARGGFAFEGGIEAGTALLAGTPRPTAIFATNDDSAAGVMLACSRAGVEVPRDVSVCGFDDSWIARTVWPYLTTINQPIKEMGYTAARMLLDRDASETGLVTLPFRLVKRDSVAGVLSV
ncbi:LacI family transcriptional regulator [Sphingobium sp. OAS761]|uniref:LacI family DNA-binding transcriptional regulator n=1 Tax=Sphingobium sp. OAS761 TaxID=2817901 RepID=UPI00209E0AA7|nr:LacI family DNA-binding transcriptional regulator [Sphingobium sp. OAS761]MCP1472316.1 LacI family transcriptional regulator [Sphingobium sp. OAS761]